MSRTVFVVFPYTRCGGLSGAEILSRRVLGITESTPLPGDLEFRAAPTAWGCRARTTRPTGHDTVTLCLYPAKGQGSLSVFVRTTRSAGECQSPMGKPQAVGGECAPDNPPQPVPVRGSPRTTFPSPVKGRNRGSLQQDACTLAMATGRVFSWRWRDGKRRTFDIPIRLAS